MTPWKYCTRTPLSWTISIAWGTEENVDFFFPGSHWSQRHKREGSGPWPLQSATPACKEFNVLFTREWMKEAQMGPAKAGVSENKAWAQSSFVLGKLPLSRKLLSCRFPFNLQLLSRVWVRGEADLADPSHERLTATMGNSGGQQPDLEEISVPGVSYLLSLLLPNQAKIWLFRFSVGGQSKYTKNLLLTQGLSCRVPRVSLPSSRRAPFPTGRSDVRQPPAVAPTPTSSLLMGTEGCRRFPISRRFSNRSVSSFRRSVSHFRMASSMRSLSFLICDTFRFCRWTGQAAPRPQSQRQSKSNNKILLP